MLTFSLDPIDLFDVLTGFWMINPCDDMEPTINEVCAGLSMLIQFYDLSFADVKTPTSYTLNGSIASPNVPFIRLVSQVSRVNI